MVNKKQFYKISIKSTRIMILIGCLLCGVSFIPISEKSIICTFVLSWMANLFLVLRLQDCKTTDGTILNKYSMFIFVCFLYAFGRTFLFSIGLITIKDLMNTYQIGLINKYLLYSVPSFYFFTIPVKRFVSSDKNSKLLTDNYQMISGQAVTVVCGFLLLLSAPFYLKSVVQFVSVAIRQGYAANYINEESVSGIFGNVIMFYVPAIAFLIVNMKNRILKYILLFMLLLPAMGYLFAGARGNAMALIICLVFLWLADIGKPEKRSKHLIAILLGGIILLGLFATLRDMRDYSLGSPIEIITIFISENLIDGIKSTIGEIGSTMYTWIRVAKIVPSTENFLFGYSYVASVLSCIPSVLIGYSFANDAALDVWLTQKYNANYGLGFSMFAESYYNFGYLGIVFIFFVGLFMFYFISGNIIKNWSLSYKNAVTAIALYIFTNVARKPMGLSVRNVFYGIIIPLLLIKIVNMIIKKRYK